MPWANTTPRQGLSLPIMPAERLVGPSDAARERLSARLSSRESALVDDIVR